MTYTRLTLSCCALAAAWCGNAFAQDSSVEEQLRRQLQERDAEISNLKQQLKQLQGQQLPAPLASATPSSGKTPGVGNPSGAVIGQSNASATSEDDELASALESSLLRQGGAVLQPGTIAIEPELSYFYDESSAGTRRDGFGTAISLRYGLPAAMQADLYVPYVIRDYQAGTGSTSGIGDVRLGLTKQLMEDREGQPALLAFGRWRFPTGDIDRTPATGSGQHALQLGMTTTKRMDPVLLIGSLSYTANFGSAQFRDGSRIEAGNVFGARLGANLAATPDTSFFWGVSYNTHSADRYNDERIALSDRARGFLELGATRVIGRGRFVNLGLGLGVTPAAPRFAFTASLPILF